MFSTLCPGYVPASGALLHGIVPEWADSDPCAVGSATAAGATADRAGRARPPASKCCASVMKSSVDARGGVPAGHQ